MDKKSFFILYPRIAEAEAKAVVDEINYRLCIDYQLWSYAEVDDEEEYFERVIQPEIENTRLVLAIVAKDTNNDFLLKKGCKLASDLGEQQIIPIKIGKGRVKAKDWAFRTDFVDFDDEEERIKFIENMFGWLGLRKEGDMYGSRVTLGSDVSATVTRNDEVIGKVSPNQKLVFNLAKGNGEFVLQTGQNWNKYAYHLPNNDDQLEFDATLKDNIKLSNTFGDKLIFDPMIDEQPKWDVTDRTDFRLRASSEDGKKRNAIFNSYERCYKATLRPCPEYDTKEFRNRGYLVLLVLLFSVLFGVFYDGEWYENMGYPILIFLGFLILRKIRKKQLRSWNRRKERKMKEEVDDFNRSRWAKCLTDMNSLLECHGLESMKLSNLGTPSQFIRTDVDIVGYAQKGYDFHEQKNYEEALRWYRYAAQEGSDYAQNALGNMYFFGEGVPVDYDKAVYWYRMAATQYNKYGQYNLASMYHKGNGVRKDYIVALKWYLRAAEQGHAQAQENAALLLKEGKDGVQRNSSLSAKWFGKAAEQGLAVSQYNYGQCLEYGRGVRRDYNAAFEWYSKAAELGVPDAMRRLGYMYKKGRGVPVSLEESQKWYALAEKNKA